MIAVTRLKVLAVCLSFLLGACGGETPSATQDANATDAASEDVEKAAAVDEILPTDMVLGDAQAPVTVVEYASTTCPACAAFHKDVFPAIEEKFINTGKIKFVFREFPTSPVELSLIGSVFARCTADEGGAASYFQVLKSLFNDQREWVYGDDPKASLLQIAAQTGMDEQAFDACLRRQELVDLVQTNVKEGRDRFAVRSTPTLFIGSEKIRDRSPEALEQAIEAALSEAE